jgi:hypothetical protein
MPVQVEQHIKHIQSLKPSMEFDRRGLSGVTMEVHSNKKGK